MIPKIIHYVWLGHGTQSDAIKKCIGSWHEILADYEIKCWDESSYDISSASTFVKEAYSSHQWAFAADYVRLWALNQYGGIYLDTDVEVRRSLDSFLHYRLFMGTQTFLTQTDKRTTRLNTNLSIGVIGCEAQHPYIQECIHYFDNIGFIDKKDSTKVSNYDMAELLKSFGYENKDLRQSLSEGIEIFPSTVFADRVSPSPSAECYTYHWGEMSWFHPKERGLFYKICWHLNLMRLYHWIEQIRQK